MTPQSLMCFVFKHFTWYPPTETTARCPTQEVASSSMKKTSFDLKLHNHLLMMHVSMALVLFYKKCGPTLVNGIETHTTKGGRKQTTRNASCRLLIAWITVDRIYAPCHGYQHQPSIWCEFSCSRAAKCSSASFGWENRSCGTSIFTSLRRFTPSNGCAPRERWHQLMVF